VNHITVTGLGSNNGDDSIGWVVASCVQEQLQDALPVRVLSCDRTGMEWLYRLRPDGALYLIDAVYSNGVPGTIVHYPDISELPMVSLPHRSSHGLGLPALLSLAQTLGLLPRRVEFWGMEIANHKPDSPLTKSVSQAVEVMASRLCVSIYRELAHLVKH